MIATFVYGTLRIGQGNYAWSSGDVVSETPNCTATGGLYFFRGNYGFPVADFTEEGTIIGDVLYYPEDSQALYAVAQMESGAGYEPVHVDVTTPDGEVVNALVWHWPHPWRGEKIPNGDWISTQAHGVVRNFR